MPSLPPHEVPLPVPVLPEVDAALDVDDVDDVDDAPPIPPPVVVVDAAPLVVVEAPPVPGMHAEESPHGTTLLPQPARAERTTALVKTRVVVRMVDRCFRERRAAAGRGKIAGGSASFA